MKLFVESCTGKIVSDDKIHEFPSGLAILTCVLNSVTLIIFGVYLAYFSYKYFKFNNNIRNQAPLIDS